MKTPQLLEQFPMASGYIMGTYGVDTGFLDGLLKDKIAVKLMEKLENNIKTFHSTWNRDEIYYRGVDLSEAFIDVFEKVDQNKLDEDEKLELLHRMKKKVKHHHTLVLLAHAIGTQYYESQH